MRFRPRGCCSRTAAAPPVAIASLTTVPAPPPVAELIALAAPPPPPLPGIQLCLQGFGSPPRPPFPPVEVAVAEAEPFGLGQSPSNWPPRRGRPRLQGNSRRRRHQCHRCPRSPWRSSTVRLTWPWPWPTRQRLPVVPERHWRRLRPSP